MPSDERSEKQAAAQQAVDILHEISTILNCHLDRRSLSICISMIENGVNPEALATAVKELRGEVQQTQIEATSSANAPAPRRR
ncbi:mitotic-spindle organizing gamma-tubulin ring associated-domain-containing protein [Rhypophila decipiens]|uniref:Mitotic-spindle organizing protein 1 n=1 Tax=Rhypophila decipiens TaxID=261697 RepID=A0AAN7B9V5_9PEZI|nr:mitotic-spindle organizing gamma-tubulin ring associated-domain-containing protein [Rhypophila decipiens]